MITHKRKRLEFILERSSLPRLFELFERSGVEGHTQIPVLEGQGQHGRHYNTRVLSVYDAVMVLAVVAEDTAAKVLEESRDIVDEQIGVVFVSDVEVLRGERFS